MELIRNYIIWVNKTVGFSIESNEKLLNLSFNSFFPEGDFITEQQLLVRIISALADNDKHEIHGMQGNFYLGIQQNVTEISLWNEVLQMPTSDFKEFLKNIGSFLAKWNSKALIEEQIFLAMQECMASSHDLNQVFIKQVETNVQLRLILSQAETESTYQTYFKNLEWPQHLKMTKQKIDFPSSKISDGDGTNQDKDLSEFSFFKGYYLSEAFIYEDYHAGHKFTENQFTAYQFYRNGEVSRKVRIDNTDFTKSEFDSNVYKGTYTFYEKVIEMKFEKGKKTPEIITLTILNSQTLLNENLVEYTFITW